MLGFGLVVRWMINVSKRTPDFRRKILGSRNPSNLEIIAAVIAIPVAVCVILTALFLFRSAIFRV